MTRLDADSLPAHAASRGSASRPIHVLVVDDHPVVRAGVQRLIEDQPDMCVVADAASAEEALAGLDLIPDVLVVDYHLGGAHNGLWLTRRLGGLRRPPSVLVYSAFADQALAAAAIVAGADGLLSKRALGQELCDVIRRLAHGRRSLPTIPRALSQAMGSGLGPRDAAVFGMLMHGDDPEEVMDRLAVHAGELASSRERILRAVAPKLGTLDELPGEQHMPLDYEPIRAELNARPARGAEPARR
jgi:DNA-binding NarL/FixJ family response regulator